MDATASQLTVDFYAARGRRFSGFTVSRRLRVRGLFAERAAVCVPISSANKQARLASCRDRRRGTLINECWKEIIL